MQRESNAESVVRLMLEKKRKWNVTSAMIRKIKETKKTMKGKPNRR